MTTLDSTPRLSKPEAWLVAKYSKHPRLYKWLGVAVAFGFTAALHPQPAAVEPTVKSVTGLQLFDEEFGEQGSCLGGTLYDVSNNTATATLLGSSPSAVEVTPRGDPNASVVFEYTPNDTNAAYFTVHALHQATLLPLSDLQQKCSDSLSVDN